MTEHGVNTGNNTGGNNTGGNNTGGNNTGGNNTGGNNTGGNVVRNPDVRVADSCRCGVDVVADTRGAAEDRTVRDRAADCPEPFHALPGSR